MGTPDCFSILRSVPIGKSRFGCETVTRPDLALCLNWAWLPFRETSNQPSARSRFITFALVMCIYTHQATEKQHANLVTRQRSHFALLPRCQTGSNMAMTGCAFPSRLLSGTPYQRMSGVCRWSALRSAAAARKSRSQGKISNLRPDNFSLNALAHPVMIGNRSVSMSRQLS